MSRPPGLYQWNAQIATHFPGLSKPMVAGLALWSLGMVIVGACSLSARADWWSCRLGEEAGAGRERLREVYREKEAKAGSTAASLVEACWVPWLGWVLEGWEGTSWQWPWTLRAWSSGSWSWRSACSTGATRCRSPGRY